MSLLLIALVQLFLLFRNVISTCSTTSDVEFTFYGFPDGPSDTTSFGCLGTQQIADGTAGGDGSYANPETFATALNNPNFVPCEIIYIPLFQKYFQYMDHCEKCMELYPNTIRIDLWIGTDTNGGQKQIACEEAFGLETGQTIVHNPPSTLKVNAGQLWDNDSGTCNNNSSVFSNHSTSEANMCAGDPTSSSGASPGGSSAAASPPPSTTNSSAPPTSTPSSPPSTGSSSTTSGKEKVDTVAKVANIKADVAPPPPPPTTLATLVSPAPTTSACSLPSPSASTSSDECGVTAEWPTPWQGHCVGAPCHEFIDCSGELICQGWPSPVCTNPRGGQ